MITIEINIYSLQPKKEIELTTNESIKERKYDIEIISLE